jgi:Fe-S-cluster containining protein
MNESTSLHFLCKLTGKCCIHNQVILNSFDIFCIAQSLNLSAKFLFEKKILSYVINKNNYWMDPVINLGKDNVCPFLKAEDMNYLCEIHTHRPTVCRIFPLNYNFNSQEFSINSISRERCKNCFNDEKEIKISDYILESDLSTRIKIEESYREFLEEIISLGVNLKDIIKNEKKQQIFFKIQEILYEKYPGKYEENHDFSWDDIKTEILDLIHFS